MIIYWKNKEPCGNHRISFPTDEIKVCPEIKNISHVRCPVCGWFVTNI
jgi:hypothetical protein